MRAQNANTEKAILEAGRMEFLEYGYEKASLRRIAGAASVTTGAIYGYFKGKEALFDALCGETAREFERLYGEGHDRFAALPPEKQPGELNTLTEEYVPWMIEYVYDHFEDFKLICCCGAPGTCESFFERLAKIEEQSCYDFADALKSMGHPVPELNDMLLHIVCRSFFQQIQEFVFHETPREEAVSCARTLARFQYAGWKQILGL